MKKSIIASIIALGMVGGAAHAADVAKNNIFFHGSVTDTTCDITPSVNGTLLPSGTINLPVAQVGQEGQGVEFALKAADPTAAGCAGLTNQKTAIVSWVSDKLDATGLRVDGQASDAMVLLSSVNAKTPGAINLTANTAEFTADNVIGDGLKFSAKTKGGNTAGTFSTAASFTVAYK